MQGDKIHELREKQIKIEACGGKEQIKKQHEKGKKTARERLNLLLDPGSFVEIGQFISHRATEFGMEAVDAPADGVITGYGLIDGRQVYVYSQDFTVIGGSLGEMHAKKICRVMDLALANGSPLIGINDSGGARIQEGVSALNGYGEIFKHNTLASGVIPQISVILGPCAGGAVYSPALTDFVFMVDKISQMFITGPQVIKSVTGEDVTSETLGGAATHSSVSGVAHFRSSTEAECFNKIRELFNFIPSNNLAETPQGNKFDPINRLESSLQKLIPSEANKPYEVKDVLHSTLDNGYFFEIQENYAQNIVIGFGRLNGQAVGIIANQPRVLAGCLDINASDKASRFIRFCDAFNIPLLTLVDTPGYLPGIEQEFGGIIRHGAKLLYAYSEATVPKITLVLRKAYGGAYLAMCSRSLGADQILAWPNAEIAVMGPEGAANIIFRKEIAEAENPVLMRQQKINEYRAQFANPYVAAAHGYVDLIIDPAETRPALIQAFEASATKKEMRPSKKHGNFPV